MTSEKSLFFLLFLSIADRSIGQSELGVKGGYSPFLILNNSFPEETSFSSRRNAWSSAIFFNQKIFNKLLFRIQLEYFSHDFTVDSEWGGPNGGSHINYTCSIGYINLYFTPQYSLGRKQRTFVFCGIYVGHRVNARIDGTEHYWYNGTVGTDTIHGSATKSFTANDLGVTVGGGYRLPLTGSFGLVFETSSSIGLLNLSHAWQTGFFNFINFKFEVGFSYRINAKESHNNH